MANRDDERESSDGQILTHALLKLRMRDGLVLARLDKDRRGLAAPLLRLPAVQRQAVSHDIESAAAALQVVGECVRDMTVGTHQIVADATLALGLFTESYSDHGLPEKVIRDLRSDALGRRRAALLSHWHRLHEALNLTPGAPPSDRTLRETVELRVLRELAYDLVGLEQYSTITATGAPTSAKPEPRRSAARQAGRVIVVGGAVMDATFRTKMIPQHETSGPRSRLRSVAGR